MKRAAALNENDEVPPPKKKRGPRGPYLAWARNNLPMPKSTKFNRLGGSSSSTSQISQKPNRHSQKRTSRRQFGKRTENPPTAVSVEDLTEPSLASHGSSALLDSAMEIRPHSPLSCQLESEAQVANEVQEQEQLSHALETEENCPFQVITSEQEEDQPGATEVIDLAEIDGFQNADEVDSDEGIDDNEDAHSEESFILWADEDQDDDAPSQAIPEDPPSDDDVSSDEEMLETPEVNLSVDGKIQLLLLLATMKRHNMSYTAAEDVMELVGELACGEGSYQVSRHIMKMAIEKYSCPLTEHHVCSNCWKYIGIVNTTSFTCESCRTELNTLVNRKKGNMFLYLSLRDQLIALLEQCSDRLFNPTQHQKINDYNYEDIYDGNFYKKITGNGVLTFNFFVDGLQVASTSKHSAWPVLVCLNELPVHIRRKNILMASLWLSLKKPRCNEYLKPFVAECIELQERGLSFLRNGVRTHFTVQPLMCVCDTIARPMLRNSTQFNGLYGCGLCVHPGIRMRHQRGYIRSYTTRDRQYPLRTHDEIMDLARRARPRFPARGIRGFSILSNIPNFDMARCLDLDLFHALVNVAKRFANLWFLEKFKGRPYNMFSKFAQIDARFLQITPTSDVSRVPRSLTQRTDFRGHEWFHWVLEYSLPVLKYYLPARYLNHWALLVHGIVLIMQCSVAKSELVYSGRFLSRFVSDIDELYGRQHVTISVHLLTHLEASVKDFGQPWSHSAFIFEAFNAEIKQAVKSSNGVAQQICRGMQRKIALQKLEEDVKDCLSDHQAEFLEKMKFSGLRLADPHLSIGPAALMGKPRESLLPAESLAALRRAGIECHERTTFTLYKRCVLNGEMYHSTNYKRVSKQNNCVVLLDYDDVFNIKTFIVYKNNCYILGNIIDSNRQLKLCDIVLPHIRVLKEQMEGVQRCFPVSQIQSKLLSFFLRSPAKETLRIACVNVLGMEMLR